MSYANFKIKIYYVHVCNLFFITFIVFLHLFISILSFYIINKICVHVYNLFNNLLNYFQEQKLNCSSNKQYKISYLSSSSRRNGTNY